MAYDLLGKVKKVPVKVLKELLRYLVNRIQMGMMREMIDLWDKGVASAADIDRACVSSFGFRLATRGQLLNMDLAYRNGTLWRQGRSTTCSVKSAISSQYLRECKKDTNLIRLLRLFLRRV